GQAATATATIAAASTIHFWSEKLTRFGFALMRSSCARSWPILLLLGGPFPLHELQVQHENAIEDWHKQKRDESCHPEPAYLRVTQRFPERPAMQRERKQRQHRRADGDHDRAQPHDSGID